MLSATPDWQGSSALQRPMWCKVPKSMRAFEEIDIHNMTKTQAQTAIDALLRKNRGEMCRLTVIHGFHGGTVLRDFVRSHYRKHPQVKRVEIGLNQGETTLIIREL